MIEVAIFGAGRIGKIHAGNIVRQPGVKLKIPQHSLTIRYAIY